MWRWFLIVTLLCSGCTYHHAVESTRNVLTDMQMLDQVDIYGGRDWVVPRTVHWLVMPPVHGPDSAADYRLSRSLAAALRQEFAAVSLVAEPVPLGDALLVARQQGAHILVVPNLLYSGDGANSWQEWRDASSDKPYGRDRVGVQLVVYDALSGKAVDTVRMLARESWVPSIDEDAFALFDQGFTRFAQTHAYQQREKPR